MASVHAWRAVQGWYHHLSDRLLADQVFTLGGSGLASGFAIHGGAADSAAEQRI